jgi:uncharacterized protein (TIGR00661 family)
MGQAEFGNLKRKTRILVAPLDWGLGHATRCIPIIRELLNQNCDVWLAGENSQKALLGSEFPDLPFVDLPGYRIQYARAKKIFTWKIIMQVPKIFLAVKKENKWLKKTNSIHQFDAVISDNRFGLYHNKIPCVFITHQLQIKSPLGYWSEKILQRWNYRFINRFIECWVPDMDEKNSLAGELSHPLIHPSIPVKYLGPLSRLEKKESEEVKDQLLIVLSGPEPQRSFFEDKIINEISHYPGRAVVVRGLPLSLSVIPSSGMIKFYNHLSSEELGNEMGKAEWVISRCGYSTIMDLVNMQKKSILIPTAGQSEQEYLAKHLQQKKIAYCIEQKNFSITGALAAAKKFDYAIPSADSSEQMKKIIISFINRLHFKP